MEDPEGTREPEMEVVAGIVVRAQRVLVTRRRAGDSFGGRWEIPGGKREPGEGAAAALDREFREELGVGAILGREYASVRYRDPAGRDVRVRFYLAELRPGKPRPLEVERIEWADAARLRSLDFIPSNLDAVRRLAEELGGASESG